MIPGKRYTPELVLAIAWRHKWLIAIPAVVVAVVGCTITYFLPDTYRSEARILIVPQRVPESYVRPTVTTRLEDRLNSINQQVRSRTKLERIIEEFNLYAERRKTDIMQDIVEDMSRNIDVDIVQGDVFLIGFSADNPREAREVTDRLATFFIDESLKDRTSLAENTTEFLETEAAGANAKLRELERKIAEYKMRHASELPSQVEANYSGLNGARNVLQQVNLQLAQNQSDRIQAQRRVADLTARVEEAANTSSAAAEPARLMPKAAELARARAELAANRKRYRPGHPEIDKVERTIERLVEEAAEEAAAVPLGSPERGNPVLDRAINNLDDAKADLKRYEAQIELNLAAQRKANQDIEEYQRRIEAAPIRDTQLVDLMRDYTTLKTHYDSLSSKKIDSQLSANVERRQIGEQFRILDPARLPEKPSSPNRQQLYLLSIVLALVIGVGVAGGAEYLDRSLRSEDDVRLALALPVLATIPEINTATRVSLLRRVLTRSAASLAAVVSAASMASR